MPRLKPSPAEQRRQTFRSIMRYNADRMRHLSAWSYEDLCNIFKKLRFSQSDIETLFKN